MRGTKTCASVVTDQSTSVTAFTTRTTAGPRRSLIPRRGFGVSPLLAPGDFRSGAVPIRAIGCAGQSLLPAPLDWPLLELPRVLGAGVDGIPASRIVPRPARRNDRLRAIHR